MKKSLLLTVILILSMMVLFGCAKEEAQVPPTTPETNQEETPVDEGDTEGKPLAGQNLKVAMSANYKYFETVVVDASGKETYEGLDIDILDKLSENLGFTYEIMNMPFASLIGSLQSNQADFVISGMSYTEERAQSVDFSDKYAVAKIGVLLNEDSDMSSAADLKGKKVACSAGTNFENIIKSIDGAELVTFDGQAAVTQELMMGRVDAAVTGGSAVKNISESNEGLKYFILDPAEVNIKNLDTYNIAFPKGSELVSIFNDEIANLTEDGTLDELIIKWLGEEYLE